MPRSPSPRILALAALALGTATFTAAPSGLSASDNTVFYTATLTSPAEETRYVAGGRIWLCDGTDCIAQRSNARPLRVCRDFKRAVGPVSAFTADGRALDADKLAKCNRD